MVLAVLVTMTAAVDGAALAKGGDGAGSRSLSHPVAAAGSPASRGALSAGRPLSQALNASGGIRRGAQGTFNVRGYRMVLGAHGAPRFVRPAAGISPGFAAASPADVNWSDAFGNVGAANASTINAIAVSGQDIYIGGSFSELSYDAALPANNVAMYDGHGWSSLGSGSANGVNGAVHALAVAGADVYVGGSFNSAGGASANAIAGWNGTKWSALGAGMSDPVSGNTPVVDALAVSGSKLYAGGSFDDAGPAVAHSVAVWSGSAWSGLGAGIQSCVYFDQPGHCYQTPGDGQVNALAVAGSTVYAGGSFNLAGGKVLSGLAVWNGTSWSTVGGSVINNTGQGIVNSISLNGSAIYIGGTFDHVAATYTGSAGGGGISAASVAFWNGAHWSALASGANNCSGCGSATVSSVAYWNGRLYMSGSFYGAGGDGQPNTAQWNGVTWTPVGPNLDAAPSALIPTASGVMAVGGFATTADSSVILNHLGRWNGSAWSGYGLGLSYGTNAGSVGVVAAANHTLYAGGNFYTAGSTPAHNLAELNGTTWGTMGGGLSGGNSAPYAMVISGADVYVGGSFSAAGSTSATNIAMWDGRAWHALGSGLDGTVFALAFYNGKLWVGGSFAHAGPVAASDVAIWDPARSTWSKVGGGLDYNGGTVDALAGLPAPYNHYMVIGGNFGQVDTGGSNPSYATVNSIVYFDTSASITGPLSGYYTMPGSAGGVGVYNTAGYPGTVAALLVDGTKAYVGGAFDTGGDVASRGFSRYDLNASSNAWSSPGVVGGTPGAMVNSILKYGSSYYLAGNFTTAGGVSASGVAQYTPASGHWAALGSGLAVGGSINGGSGSSLAESADGLYVGGGFALAGGKAAENLALWTATAFPITVGQTVSPTSQAADQNVTFTATAKNTATASAAGVVVSATLPANAIFVSATPSQGACTRNGRALSCSLGTLGAGASAAVPIVVQPIQPPSVSNVVSVYQSGGSSSNPTTTSAAVTAVAGVAYTAVTDSGFAPASLSIRAGNYVQYDYYGPSAHTVVDPVDACTSPSKSPISDSACRYPAGGAYTAEQDAKTAHTELVLVSDLLSAGSVTHGSAVTITADTVAVRSGWGIDIQVEKSGGAWSQLKWGSTAQTASYTPAAAGTYYFRSRLRNLSTKATSGYGPAAALTAK